MFHSSGWWAFISYDEKKDQPQFSWALLRRVWGYAKPYRLKILGLLLTIFVITGLSLIPPLLYRDLIDYTLPGRDMTRLNWLAAGMIGIPLLNALIGMGQRYLSATIGESLIADLRNALFNHMQRMSLRFFTHTKTGELMSRLNNDVVGAQNAVTGTFITILTNVITVITTLIIMFSLEWRLTLLSIAILPLFILPTRRIGEKLREIRRQSMDLNAKMNTLMQETLNVDGVLLVKLFGRQTDEMVKFSQRSVAVADVGIRLAMIGRWFFMGLGLVGAIGTAIVFWVGGYLVWQGVFTVGTIVAFGSYLVQLYGPLSSISNAHIEFASSMVSFERVFEVLDLPLEIEDKPEAFTLTEVKGAVAFQNVSFSYTEGGDGGAGKLGLKANGDNTKQAESGARETTGGSNQEVKDKEQYEPATDSDSHPVGVPRRESIGGDNRQLLTNNERRPNRPMALHEVSFEIEPGQLMALVGPSGAGKTTITYLLPRLYDPTSGRICLDGYDLRDISLRSLAQTIGMVTQEAYLFHDTLRANLLYAKPDATQDEIEAACQAANIHHFIIGLPDGYDTIVGERGYRLSGGEKQRIAIARVILKDPRILVLDEATSSLDSHSEALIQEALERIMQNRTSIVIAHRLSTILAADVILVMNEGRLAEQGYRVGSRSAHEELLARGGLYANLYHTQFRHTLIHPNQRPNASK